MQFDSDRYELIKHERIEELKSEGYLSDTNYQEQELRFCRMMMKTKFFQ